MLQREAARGGRYQKAKCKENSIDNLIAFILPPLCVNIITGLLDIFYFRFGDTFFPLFNR